MHTIANVQRIPANIIFTDAEGHILDNDDASVAPSGDTTMDHRSVDPSNGVYMGLHNNPPPVHVAPDEPPPPKFAVNPAAAGADALPAAFQEPIANNVVLPDDNYFLPLAEADGGGTDWKMGTANDVVGQEEAGIRGGAEMGMAEGGSAENTSGNGVVDLDPLERAALPPAVHMYNLQPCLI